MILDPAFAASAVDAVATAAMLVARPESQAEVTEAYEVEVGDTILGLVHHVRADVNRAVELLIDPIAVAEIRDDERISRSIFVDANDDTNRLAVEPFATLLVLRAPRPE